MEQRTAETVGGSGGVLVEDWAGLPGRDAADAVRCLGLRPGMELVASGVARGEVVGQEPGAGERVSRGSVVRLMIASGERAEGGAECAEEPEGGEPEACEAAAPAEAAEAEAEGAWTELEDEFVDAEDLDAEDLDTDDVDADREPEAGVAAAEAAGGAVERWGAEDATLVDGDGEVVRRRSARAVAGPAGYGGRGGAVRGGGRVPPRRVAGRRAPAGGSRRGRGRRVVRAWWLLVVAGRPVGVVQGCVAVVCAVAGGVLAGGVRGLAALAVAGLVLDAFFLFAVVVPWRRGSSDEQPRVFIENERSRRPRR